MINNTESEGKQTGGPNDVRDCYKERIKTLAHEETAISSDKAWRHHRQVNGRKN